MIIAKVVACEMGNRSISLTKVEKDTAFSILKQMTDQRMDLSELQKEQYKNLIDICKQYVQ